MNILHWLALSFVLLTLESYCTIEIVLNGRDQRSDDFFEWFKIMPKMFKAQNI